MALWSGTINKEALNAARDDKTFCATRYGYTKLIQVAAQLAGFSTFRLEPSGLRRYALMHHDHEFIDRAFNNSNVFPVQFAQCDTPNSLLKYARPGVTQKTLVNLLPVSLDAERMDGIEGAENSRDPFIVCLQANLPRGPQKYQADVRANLVPSRAQALYGASHEVHDCELEEIRRRGIPVTMAKVNARARGKGVNAGGDAGGDAGEGGVDVDGDEMDVVEKGDDLRAMAAHDDAELSDVDEYDKLDGFIASSSDSEQEEIEEEKKEKKRRRREKKREKKRQKVRVVESSSDEARESDDSSSDDFSRKPIADRDVEMNGKEGEKEQPEEEIIDGEIEDEPDALTLANPVPEFDGKIFLYETGLIRLKNGTVFRAAHTYVVNGKDGEFTSCTTKIADYFIPFNAEKQSRDMVARTNWPTKIKYFAKVTEAATIELRAAWKEATYDAKIDEWPESLQLSAEMFVEGVLQWSTLYNVLKCQSEGARLAQTLQSQFQELSAKVLRDMWEENRDAASTAGTLMHEKIEFFLKGISPRESLVRDARENGEIELLQFLSWYDNYYMKRGYKRFRAELRIKDDGIKVCGSTDWLSENPETGDLVLDDWKRSIEILRHGFARVVNDDDDSDYPYKWIPAAVIWYAEKCLPPLSKYYSDKFTKYALQQNIYKRIIEKNTGRHVESMHLVVCHPRQGDRYDVIDIPDMSEAVDALFALWSSNESKA